MTDPTTSGLADSSTPQVYRRNAFRVTGLPTDADRRTVRQRRQKVTTMLEVGADVDLGHDLAVDPGDVARAFDLILGDPRRRLVDELFWLWGPDTAACGCARSLHDEHDAAVRAHSKALDHEARGDALDDVELDELERLWSDAARLWGRVLRRAAFWDHVRHRIAVLDDRQLDESVIDLLRDELPVVLVKPLVRLAATAGDDQGWLADRARAWPAPPGVVNDLLEQAAEPVYESVRAGLKEVAGHLENGDPEDAAAVVDDVVLGRLDRLEEFVPHERHRRTAGIRDDTAVALNNCATKLVENIGSAAEQRAREWLGTAAGLATDPQTISLIERNGAAITEMAQALATIRKQVRELVALGRRDVARRMLESIRARVAGMAGADEIDRMLRDLGGHVPAPRQPARQPRYTPGPRYAPQPRYTPQPEYPYDSRWEEVRRVLGGVLRVVALLLATGLVLGGIYWLSSSDDGPVPVRTYSELVSDNAPVGTCIATKEGWRADKHRVPSVPCDREHWGEVLAYVQIGANPSPYPGDDVVRQHADYECAWQQAKHGLGFDSYVAESVIPDRESWNEGGKTFENYATCVVRRVDDKPLPTHGLVDADRPEPEDPTLVRDMYSADVVANPPAGACIATKESHDGAHQVVFTSCTRPHWGEILGYPVLYQPTDAWPGDDAVRAATDEACRQLAVSRGLDDAYHYNVTWPGSDWWTRTPDKPKYAVCTASSAHGNPLHTSLK